ncbi:hypothetical protein EVJ58_g11195, partial [Rhodofomes roseus]
VNPRGAPNDALPPRRAPRRLRGQEEVIEWHLKTNAVRNPLSARVSVPAIIQPAPEGTVSAWIWQTPLRSTAPYWTSWFTSLSKLFLTARTARLLVLAGAERLDRELMISQMQGKFQLTVVTGVGHMLTLITDAMSACASSILLVVVTWVNSSLRKPSTLVALHCMLMTCAVLLYLFGLIGITTMHWSTQADMWDAAITSVP